LETTCKNAKTRKREDIMLSVFVLESLHVLR